MVHTQFPKQGLDKFWVSAPEFFELRERSRSYDGLALYNTGQTSIDGTSEPMRVRSASASAELFDVLGVEALHGRAYGQEEDRPGAEAVAVVSFELWQRAFGADLSWIGKRIEVDGAPRTILGVMPPRFDVDAQGVEISASPRARPREPSRPRFAQLLRRGTARRRRESRLGEGGAQEPSRELA